jgi:hypothetical protein
MYKMFIPATLLTLLTATSALAEHKLLVTDVPDPGHVEARIDFDYTKEMGKNFFLEKISSERIGSTVTVAAGVVNGLKVSATLPYTFNQRIEGIKANGFEDLTLGARYSLTKSLIKLPVDIAVGFDWKLDSARRNDPGTRDNSFSPSVAVSKNLHMFIPYVVYQPEFIVHAHDGQTIHNLTVGTEIEFSHHYSLDVKVKGSFNGSRGDIKASNTFEVEVGPYINVFKNLYLLPTVSYAVVGDVETKFGEKLLQKADGYKIGFGLYYLF